MTTTLQIERLKLRRAKYYLPSHRCSSRVMTTTLQVKRLKLRSAATIDYDRGAIAVQAHIQATGQSPAPSPPRLLAGFSQGLYSGVKNNFFSG